ncbi:uncharacterized protein FIBRA_08038 [Fibroporia radiculosa]|uniref:DUF6535 domain-containing protein n=1 Tax=Fibroporia radiculosa TaxID=599839 RepID=J4H4Y6_9APHY|nr:uncharacterized protein FIBRA_08038 [Fibroporia radiculosa]CCM05804.1 predicted protein [Fibroporia radiculosa]
MAANIPRPSVAVSQDSLAENAISISVSEVPRITQPSFAMLGDHLRPPNISARTESNSSTAYVQETPKKRWQSLREANLQTSPIEEVDGEQPPEPLIDTADASAWRECSKMVYAHDQSKIDNWNKEIDALLLFAGLFSAVVTAFTVPYYATLMPSTDPTAAILAQISAQLASFQTSTGFVNSTEPAFSFPATDSSSPAAASSLIDRVNALWLAALVVSLAAATIAISLRQWLNQHAMRDWATPRQSVLVWCIRHKGFNQWHVEGIVALVPILLHFALILFLAGLVALLWSWNRTIFGVVMALAGLTLLFTIYTTLMPAIFLENCPYKSPQALLMVGLTTVVSRVLFPILCLIPYLGGKIFSRTISPIRTTWAAYQLDWIRPYEFVSDSSLLVSADNAMMDDTFLDGVVDAYIKERNVTDASDALKAIYDSRSQSEGSSVNPTILRKLRYMAVRLVEGCQFEGSLPESLAYLLEQNRYDCVPELFERVLDVFQNRARDMRKETRTRLVRVVLDISRTYVAHVQVHYLHTLLSYIPLTLADLDAQTFVRIVVEILLLSLSATSLDIADRDYVRDELQNKLLGQRPILEYEDDEKSEALGGLSPSFSSGFPFTDEVEKTPASRRRHVLDVLDGCLEIAEDLVAARVVDIEIREEEQMKRAKNWRVKRISSTPGAHHRLEIGLQKVEECTSCRSEQARQLAGSERVGYSKWREIIAKIKKNEEYEDLTSELVEHAGELFLPDTDWRRLVVLLPDRKTIRAAARIG